MRVFAGGDVLWADRGFAGVSVRAACPRLDSYDTLRRVVDRRGSSSSTDNSSGEVVWYYRHTQEYEERSASDLAYDLQDAGFPKPNVTRLEQDLRKSKFTIRGRRKETFQIDIRKLGELDDKYLPLLSKKEIKVEDNILPSEWFTGTRRYLEQIVLQINGSHILGPIKPSLSVETHLVRWMI